MENCVMKSKGNGIIIIVTGVVFVLLSAIMGIIMSGSMFEGEDIAEQILPLLPSLITLAFGAFLIVAGINFSKTKIYVYEDHIEGVCVVDKRNREFYLKYGKISNVSIDKTVLLIQSDAITHKMNLPAKDAKDISVYINSKL